MAGARDGGRVTVVGDLNARAGSRTPETPETPEGAGLRFAPVEGSTYHLNRGPTQPGPEPTGDRSNRGLNLFGAIGHLAHGPRVEAAGEPVVLRRRLGDRWPSHHYPVTLDVVLDG